MRQRFILLLGFTAMAVGQTITTFAGNGTAGFAGDGAQAAQAQINRVVGLASDTAGNIYLAEENNNRVRKVDRNGIITTYGGNGTAGFSGDGGPATQAQLNTPLGVCTDIAGNLFVMDYGNKRVRRISTSGIITTVFGTGSNVHSGDGGPATSASGVIPIRCAVDRFDNFYFVDQAVHRVRKIASGIVTTVAGNGTQGFTGDGGPATSASMNNPTAIATDGAGNLYVTDQFNHRIRRIDTGGTIQTVAFSGNNAFSGDGVSALSASSSFPGSVAVDAAGSVYIVDTNASRIRKLSGGTITTIAGTGTAGFSGDGGAPLAATFNAPFAITIDLSGNLYIGDTTNNRIRRIGSVPLAGPPVVTSAGVTNAASFQTGIAPGAIITIFGSNLGAPPGQIVVMPGSLWTTQLSGVTVTMDGVAVPVYRILSLNGQEQLSVLAPFSLTGSGSVNVQVTTAAGASAAVSVPIRAAQPGVFLLDGASAGATHADGSVAGASNPATRGETVIVYLTGLGTVSNAPAAGSPASFTTLSRTVLTPRVTIGGVAANVDFSGLTPGFIGLYQINAVVPAGVTAGTLDLVVDVNGVSSNTARLPIR